ncbi:Purpurin [Acipenser ruthenus]|uniref:Purpurin n=1 Tax=Acipenser ruthenus TaxID=7906 RepID=A0A444UTI2_ACIRT|nr:Purpurin [Acipenser ruthenus]
MSAQYTVPNPAAPGKMFMNYQGLASYLSSGGDNYWVIDTDYDNYAITYACRSLKDDGTCDDGYSLIFSRNPRGLPPAIQRIVRQKQEEICMAGQFEPVLQSGVYTIQTLLNNGKMDYSKVALLIVVLSYIEECWSASCVVDSFSVKEDFDPKKYAGKWYALQKKDPEGLFLQDNISAEYTIDDEGIMTASSKGRVKLFG